jgi:ATP-dependent RNA helicase DeaD
MTENTSEQQVVSGSNGFDKLNVQPQILRALEEAGYEQMFPIQEQAIVPLLEGKDVIGQAHTGSGKTAAYSIPIIQSLSTKQSGYVQALVIVPTRELAIQVAEEFNKLSKYTSVKAYPVYGGQAITPQIERLLKRPPQVVIATPGRLIDHIERRTIDLGDVLTVVLDEADRMLDMGFIDDVDYILKQLPPGTQTALFSATMPREIVQLSQKYMERPVKVLIDTDEISLDTIVQKYAVVDERSKFVALVEYIKRSRISSGIIFCATKIRTQRLAERLEAAGFKAAPIHGDLSQSRREHAMRNFRNGYVELLVATDVAARGIDVPIVSHVINYDVPQDPLTYFHRIGRTARAGKTGSAMTLVSEAEYPDFARISGMTQASITKVTGLLPEGFRSSREDSIAVGFREGSGKQGGGGWQSRGRRRGMRSFATFRRDAGNREGVGAGRTRRRPQGLESGRHGFSQSSRRWYGGDRQSRSQDFAGGRNGGSAEGSRQDRFDFVERVAVQNFSNSFEQRRGYQGRERRR